MGATWTMRRSRLTAWVASPRTLYASATTVYLAMASWCAILDQQVPDQDVQRQIGWGNVERFKASSMAVRRCPARASARTLPIASITWLLWPGPGFRPAAWAGIPQQFWQLFTCLETWARQFGRINNCLMLSHNCSMAAVSV